MFTLFKLLLSNISLYCTVAFGFAAALCFRAAFAFAPPPRAAASVRVARTALRALGPSIHVQVGVFLEPTVPSTDGKSAPPVCRQSRAPLRRAPGAVSTGQAFCGRQPPLWQAAPGAVTCLSICLTISLCLSLSVCIHTSYLYLYLSIYLSLSISLSLYIHI